jgi:hypothetical protein
MCEVLNLYNNVAHLLKARIVKPAETAVAKERTVTVTWSQQQLHTQTVEELWKRCFPCGTSRRYITGTSCEPVKGGQPGGGSWWVQPGSQRLKEVPAEASSQRLAWDGRQPARTWAPKQRNVRCRKPLPSSVTENTSLCGIVICKL